MYKPINIPINQAIRILRCLLSLFLILSVVLVAVESNAHDPHDVIGGIAVSTANGSKDLYIIMGHYRLLKSTDGGRSWKKLVNGLDNRFEYTDIGLAAGNRQNDVLFVGTDGDGVYRSTDSGISWKKVNQGLSSLRIKKLHVSPDYAADSACFVITHDGELFGTRNGGTTWSPVAMGPSRVSALTMVVGPDHGEKAILAGDTGGYLYISTDGGATWRKKIIDHGGTITAVSGKFIDRELAILAGTTSGKGIVLKKGFDSSESAQHPLSQKPVTSMAFSSKFESNHLIYASVWDHGVFQSNDYGARWQALSDGLTKDRQAEMPLFYAPHFKSIVSKTTSDGAEVLFLAGFDGLFTRSEETDRWTELDTELPGWILGLSLSASGNGTFDIAVNTTGAGAYLWSGATHAWNIMNSGLRKPRIGKLSFPPTYPADRHLLAIEDEGNALVRYDVDNSRWERVPFGLSRLEYLKRRISNLLKKAGVSEQLRKNLLGDGGPAKAYPKSMVLSPDYAVDKEIFIATRFRGLYHSNDGGRSVSPLNPDHHCWQLIISPDFKRDRTLFSTNREAGIHVSTDAGKSWRMINSGLAFIDKWHEGHVDATPRDIELARSAYYNISLAISPAFPDDQTLYAAGGEALYVTKDKGASWQPIAVDRFSDHSRILTLAISPGYSIDETLIISLAGRGLFKSEDAGKSFYPIGQTLIQHNHSIEHIHFSPFYPQDRTLIAASEETVFRSMDGGITWEAIPRPVRHENDNGRRAISYFGSWAVERSIQYSSGSSRYSMSPDSRATFRFVGTGVDWIGKKSPDLGKVDVFLDGKFIGHADQSGPSDKPSAIVYSISGLTNQPHQLSLKSSDCSAQPECSGVYIDAFDVRSGD